MHSLGRTTQEDVLERDKLEEVRRDISAVVSKLDQLIAASKESALADEG